MDEDLDAFPALHDDNVDLSGTLHLDGRVGVESQRCSVESEGLFVDQDHELPSSPSSALTARVGGSHDRSNVHQDFHPVLDHLDAERGDEDDLIELDQDNDSAASHHGEGLSENEEDGDEDDDDAFDQAAFGLSNHPTPDCSDCQIYARKVRYLDESNAKKATIIATKDATILALEQRAGVRETRKLQHENERLKRRVEHLTKRIDILKSSRNANLTNTTNRKANADNVRLRNQLADTRRRLSNALARAGAPAGDLVRRARVRDWQAAANSFIAGVGDDAWIDIVKRSNSQENMPKDINCVHPYIRLVSRKDVESDCQSSSDAGPDATTNIVGRHRRQATPRPLNPMANFKYPWKGSFDKLPDDIVMRILHEVLVFEGMLVHCFSRLDPFEAPAALPDSTYSNLIRGFFISDEDRKPISLTRDTLAPG
jgi:hypothetical protein